METVFASILEGLGLAEKVLLNSNLSATGCLRVLLDIGRCQDWFSSTILLGGPEVQGTNEEVSPDTSRC